MRCGRAAVALHIPLATRRPATFGAPKVAIDGFAFRLSGLRASRRKISTGEGEGPGPPPKDPLLSRRDLVSSTVTLSHSPPSETAALPPVSASGAGGDDRPCRGVCVCGEREINIHGWEVLQAPRDPDVAPGYQANPIFARAREQRAPAKQLIAEALVRAGQGEMVRAPGRSLATASMSLESIPGGEAGLQGYQGGHLAPSASSPAYPRIGETVPDNVPFFRISDANDQPPLAETLTQIGGPVVSSDTMGGESLMLGSRFPKHNFGQWQPQLARFGRSTST